ncbi:MAG: hypothetical protein RR547_03635, partial [Raoultibacter sp.]
TPSSRLPVGAAERLEVACAVITRLFWSVMILISFSADFPRLRPVEDSSDIAGKNSDQDLSESEKVLIGDCFAVDPSSSAAIKKTCP